MKYNKIAQEADFMESVHHTEYEGPFQFKQTDQVYVRSYRYDYTYL